MVAEGGEDESYESGAGFPVSGSTTILPGVGRVGAVHGPTRVPNRRPDHTLDFEVPPAKVEHPAFAPQPAHCAHIVARMMHVLADVALDPSLTPVKLAGELAGLNDELSGLAREEMSMARRMAANTAAAEAMGRGLDAVAGAPGVALKTATVTGPDGQEREVVPDVAAAMRSGHERVADPRPTQQMPVITEDMPDPRVAVESVPVPAVEVVPDQPWSPEDTGPESSESSESLSAICGDELAEAGTQVAA
jgi:hypothetical protein